MVLLGKTVQYKAFIYIKNANGRGGNASVMPIGSARELRLTEKRGARPPRKCVASVVLLGKESHDQGHNTSYSAQCPVRSTKPG
jgi:hypothetical protein